MIKECIKKHGAQNIATAMKESVQTVYNWGSRGVPLDKVVGFCTAIAFDLTPHQLSPKNYPHPHDGLPEEMRGKREEAA